MWSIGRQDLGLTDEEFWRLTPREFRALCDRKERQDQAQDLRFGQLAVLVASAAGVKKQSGLPFEMHDFFPSLRPAGLVEPTDDGLDPEVTAPRGPNVIDLPARPGENDVEMGFDRWVQMCRARVQARGG